ncbi:MAG: hypothetical protein HQK87_06225 [Nitrospinae bacterium]|nr:hypothetical protein [Nitrospinota bacterium]
MILRLLEMVRTTLLSMVASPVRRVGSAVASAYPSPQRFARVVPTPHPSRSTALFRQAAGAVVDDRFLGSPVTALATPRVARWGGIR